MRSHKKHRFDPWLGETPGGQGNPLQYSCLESPLDRGAWQAIIHGVARSISGISYISGMTEMTEHNIFHCMNILCCIYPPISVKIFGLFALLTMTNNVAKN